MVLRLLTCIGLMAASTGAAWAAPRAFLEKHCFQCHDTDTREGGVGKNGASHQIWRR